MKITDDQLRELRYNNLSSSRVSALTVPQGTSRTAWRRTIRLDCNLALGITPDAPTLSERANRACQDAARDRCAEILTMLKECDNNLTPKQRARAEHLNAMIRDAAGARLVQCPMCNAGFRRVNGVHIASKQLGMIADTPCHRVFAIHGGNLTDDNKRPWMAHVDGDVVRKQSGDARRFSSAKAAYDAACKAAPRMWHP